MNLYVVRHGQTEANVNHLFNGRNERDLTEFGIEQANSLANRMKTISKDLIFSSPLKRARHTASILNINNIEIISDDRLIERDYGKFTLKSVDLIKDRRNKLFDLENNEIKEIESYKSIYDRVGNFIEEIKEKYADKNILVVTHGDVVIAIKEFLNQKSDIQPKTCELIQFDI